jgi:hypothetical protein
MNAWHLHAKITQHVTIQKDHLSVPVNKVSKEMDWIVQVRLYYPLLKLHSNQSSWIIKKNHNI